MNDRNFEDHERTLEEISLYFSTLYLLIAAFVSHSKISLVLGWVSFACSL
jgi:hypothetical protein